MLAVKTLPSRLVRLLSFAIAPQQSRDKIEIDFEQQGNGKLRVFTQGLKALDLPELEIRDCQQDHDLVRYCHCMLYVVIDALQASQKEHRAIRLGDIVNLQTDAEEDPIPVRIAKGGTRLFRLEDLSASGDKFPALAAASYITAAAEEMNSPEATLKAARIAAEIHAKDFAFNTPRPTEDSYQDRLEESNARPYYLMSDALAALGREAEAIQALEEGVARAPYMAERIKQDAASGNNLDLHIAHLTKIDPWQIQARIRDERTEHPH